MSIQRLPVEVLGHVIRCVAYNDLFRCLTVCRLWSELVQAQLYRCCVSAVLDHPQLFEKFIRNRHHVRHITLQTISTFDSKMDQLTQLLDLSRPVKQIQSGNAGAAVEVSAQSVITAASTLSLQPQDNGSAIKSMLVEGYFYDFPSLYEFLPRVASLTRLEISFVKPFSNLEQIPATDVEHLQLKTILDSLPNLQHLSLLGFQFQQWPTSPEEQESELVRKCAGFDHLNTHSQKAIANSIATTAVVSPAVAGQSLGVYKHEYIPRESYKLKSLRHDDTLLHGVSIEALLSRLPNLEQIYVTTPSGTSSGHGARMDPLQYTRILQRNCPKIKDFKASGPWRICLFVPKLIPARQEGHITASTTKTWGKMSTYYGPSGVPIEPLNTWAGYKDLVEKEDDSIYPEVPALPLLECLECPGNDTLSSEDVGQFHRFKNLVEIDISRLSSYTLRETLPYRHTTPITGKDVQRILEDIPRLRVLTASGFVISWEDIESDDGEEDEISQVASSDRPVKVARIRRWSCEKTLEALSIGFRLPSCSIRQNRAIWEQIGRCKRLEFLGLYGSSLVMSLEHGVDAILELQRLEEIRNWNSLFPFPNLPALEALATRCRALKSIRIETVNSRAVRQCREAKEVLERVGRRELWKVGVDIN
ncbi:hypothetical protein BGW38_004519 [Lunasporangiospora selenospora]|uniref:F-box domain-containing protein n=1 Tax=Lunasporangiospora selenospora TaxID=979761 RepID=A0A9P6KHI6_9FUNG|nr:hypothetical protein BGW38_004519 [Lunasporangiospora selenospora]